MSQVLVDNGNGDPYDILAVDIDGEAALDDQSLNNSNSSEPTEKQDSGIEDKDSPNASKIELEVVDETAEPPPVPSKIKTASKLTSKIREEWAKSSKIRGPAENLKYIPPKTMIAKPPATLKGKNLIRGKYNKEKQSVFRYKFSGRQNSAEVSEKKVAPRRFERTQSLPVTKAAQKSNYNSKTAASKSKIQFSGKNSPRSKPIGTNRKPTGSKPNWNLNSSKTPMVQKKHATKTKFENLKITVKSGRHSTRKVENPTILKKKQASKDIMRMIKPTLTRHNTTSDLDKENARQHLLQLIQGTKSLDISTSANVTSLQKKAPAPNQSLFQKWRNVNLTSNSIDKTTQTLNQSQKADLPQNFLSMIANIGNTTIDEIEGDSEATTVMTCIERTATAIEDHQLSTVTDSSFLFI